MPAFTSEENLDKHACSHLPVLRLHRSEEYGVSIKLETEARLASCSIITNAQGCLSLWMHSCRCLAIAGGCRVLYHCGGRAHTRSRTLDALTTLCNFARGRASIMQIVYGGAGEQDLSLCKWLTSQRD